MAWAALSNIISHTLFQLSMNRVLWNRLLFITLIIICETEIREINTSLAIQCMQACTQGCYKTINTNFKRNNTPFVLNISQRSSEGRTGPPTHPDQIRVGQNAAILSQAVPAWLRPLSNIISHTLFQLSMNRVLWNRLLFFCLSDALLSLNLTSDKYSSTTLVGYPLFRRRFSKFFLYFPQKLIVRNLFSEALMLLP